LKPGVKLLIVKLTRRYTWVTNKVAADMTEARGRCIRRLAQTARKNAKFLLSPAEIVRYIAVSAFQSAETKAVRA
jgi:hypothetical protein